MESKNLISHKEFLAATRRAKRKQATTPMAVAVHYNKKADRVVISLSTKVEVMFNPADVEGLEDATPSQLADIEITPSGFGLIWSDRVNLCDLWVCFCRCFRRFSRTERAAVGAVFSDD